MKKLTALLLGTVIGIAFTASDASADAKDVVKNYFSSNDGNTGGYLGVNYHRGSISEVTASYLTGTDNPTKSNWVLDDGKGGSAQFGFDFGKIRFDARLGGVYSSVDNIDGLIDTSASNEAVLGYGTVNFAFDLYRFELINQNFISVALTPYVGAGIGYGGAWMTGKKPGNPVITEPAGHGEALSGEAGVLINLTPWTAIAIGYNYLSLDLKGHGTTNGQQVKTHMGSAGVRFTY